MARRGNQDAYGPKTGLRTQVPRQRELSALLDRAQAAAYLNTTERHIQRLWTERRIPAVKVGRKVRFRMVDLDAWIEAHTVPEVDR